GHDAQGEYRQSAQVAAREDIDESEDGPLLLLEEGLQQVGVNTRCGDVPAQAEHRQDAQRKQDSVTQIRYAENIADGLDQSCLPHRITQYKRLRDGMPSCWCEIEG